MEENKAPEKLYIDSREHWRKSWTAFTTKAKGDDIEYIRKDVLIEKAKEWLKLYILNHDNIDVYQIGEDFKNYMKGE